MAARGLRVTQALALHEAVGAGVVERWLSAFLLDEGGRSMTSGGADVKLIFWEIACPGKARFRERWVRHQLDSGQGFWSEEAPHAPAPSCRFPQGLNASPPTPFFKRGMGTSITGCDAAVDRCLLSRRAEWR